MSQPQLQVAQNITITAVSSTICHNHSCK